MCSETEMLIAQDLLGIKNELKKLADGVKVVHIQQEQRFRITIERAASTKGVDGFKVEANGDDFDNIQNQIQALYDYAKNLTSPSLGVTIEGKGGVI